MKLVELVVAAACRLAVWLYPPGFRRRHGNQIVAAARRGVRRRYLRHGAVAALWGGVADTADVVAGGLAERLHQASPKLRANANARSPGALHRMSQFLAEFRFSLRALRRQPTFAAVCIVTLAIAFGANVVIFTIVKRVLLDPLPYPDAGRLVWINSEHQETGFSNVSAADLADWRAAVALIDDMAGYMYWSYTFTEGEEPLDVPAMRVEPNLFSVLGIDAAIGRTFAAEDGVAGGERVAVVSHWFWEAELGADAGVVGRRLVLDGAPHTVVGVMPAGFAFPPDARNGFWTAIATDAETVQQDREVRSQMVIGRLAEGADIEAAELELDAVAAALGEAYPDTNGAFGVRVRSAHEMLVVGSAGSDAILALFAGVGFLLLIACTNVTNLMLARLSSRDREMSVRTALGAGRAQLVRQFMSETLLLAAGGGLLGLLIAVWGIRQVRTMPHLPLSRLQELQLDGGILLFALGLTLLVGALFGLLPAWRTDGAGLADSLRRSAAGAGSGRDRRLDALVIAEVALALVLLIGAGLLARTFDELMGIDVGFGRDNLLAANLYIPDAVYPEDHQQVAFFEQLVDEIESIPGVMAAAAVSALPMDYAGIDFDLSYTVVGRDAEDETPPRAQYRAATPGYFETMGIPLQRGRGFTAADRHDAPRVLLINDTLAQRAFEGADPIGESLSIPIGGPHEIVGVVRDVRHYGLGREPQPEMYIPMAQNPFGGMVVVARTASDPAAFTDAVTRAVLDVDPRQPVYAFNTMEELMAEDIAFPRLNMILSATFAGVALLLAAVGIYGVMSYSVARRTREIGVRRALGARRADALRSVLGRGMMQASIGVVTGLAGALIVTRWLQSQLFGVTALDASVFVGVPIVFLAVALLATYLPARRATKVDPLIAVRSDKS